MGRKGPRAKTKTVLKQVNKMKQLVGMPMTNKEKNLNKNHPTMQATFLTAVIFNLQFVILAVQYFMQCNFHLHSAVQRARIVYYSAEPSSLQRALSACCSAV